MVVESLGFSARACTLGEALLCARPALLVVVLFLWSAHSLLFVFYRSWSAPGPHDWSCLFLSLGFGSRRRSVAEFSNRDDMTRAVRELDDTYFADRRIRVDYVST